VRRRDFLRTVTAGVAGLATRKAWGERASSRPNVLWILAEDASPHLGCYGETAIKTPNLDALAAEGVRFQNAYVTCPVCSPCRSAFATGMYQTTIASHNHRSQNTGKKGGGNTAHYDSYCLPETIPLISDLFRAAGYYTCNGADPDANKPGKTDYNFINLAPPYDGSDWRQAPEGTPFFAQIQLRGGKWRPKDFDAGDFNLPPYYPDDPVLRSDWAEYLGCWERQDRQVGEIVQSLKDGGVYDNTLVVFLTDHGISHVRGKQFLYEEGIRVPLIIRFPDRRHAGMVRDDLALHIDLAPVSLAFADLPVPGHLQGLDLFAPDYEPRSFVVAARDRCDETIDVIRCVRTSRYKYIRNFLSYRPHMQYNQYKDAKAITKRMRQLHAAGTLTSLQDRIFNPTRPPEELYDLEADPHETVNLAESPEQAETLAMLRKQLYDWIRETRDPGLIPEPILEDLGRKYGSKLAAMRQPHIQGLPLRIVETIEAGERGDTESVRAALDAEEPSIRYWAAVWLGNLADEPSTGRLEALTEDPVPTVRVAAHLALCRLGHSDIHLPKLAGFLDEKNLIVGMYAMNAVEQTGILNDAVREAAQKALDNPYEFTQRYGRRLLALCEAKLKP